MNAKNFLGAGLIVTALCLAAGGVYAVHTLKQKKYDPETLCPLEGSKAVTLIIIDKTEPLTEPEQASARSIVQKERDAIQRGNRLTVKLLRQEEGSSDTVLDTVADLCNPGALGDPLFENPRRVAARYQNAFAGPIEAALASVEGGGSAPVSPIARAILSAVDEVPGGPDQHVKLVLISDLMEHTPDASAYAGTLGEAALLRLMPQAAQTRMKGSRIGILLLRRPKYAAQQEAATAIWRRFLGGASGHDPEFLNP
ncbi:MAG: hypothetical protein HY765_09560 [Rhodomicrobium sp.]|nr:hypothetical protein [Rhodomicrobium sp.]